MLKKRTKIGAAAYGIAAAIVGLTLNNADAHTNVTVPFKEASISFVTGLDGRNANGDHRQDNAAILRVGHDGDTYTHLDGHVMAKFRLKAKVKSGHRIFGYVITTGDPDQRRELPEELIGEVNTNVEKKIDRIATFKMDATTAAFTGPGGISPTRVQDMIDKCNAKFPKPPDSDQTIETIDMTVHAGFAAGERPKGSGFSAIARGPWYSTNESSGRPAIDEATFPVNIVCAGDSFRSAENPSPPRAGNELYSIDLKVDQHGDRCPKDVTVTAYANYKWQAKSRMRMQVNGGFPKVRFANTKKVTFAGKTFHRAEAQFNYKLDPGQKTFTLTVDGKKGKTHTETVEIKCPPFKVTSAWLKYEVEQTPTCAKKVTETATYHTTRPGWVNHEIRMQGGLVVSSGKLTSKRAGDKYVATAVRKLTMNAIDKEFMADAVDYPANSGWVPLKVECLDLKGDFSFIDHGSPKCPRTGKALITFKSNMPDNIHYSLDCTNGQHLSGFVKPVQTPQGGYVAAAMKSFNIDKTTVYSCALKTVQPGPVKLHQWKGHTFDCVIPSVETGSNDVQVAPKPTDAQPRNPRRPKVLVPAALDKAEADRARRDRIAAEKRRKAKIAAEKAKRERELAEKRRREMLKKRLEAAKDKKKKKLRRKVRRNGNTTTTSSNAQLRVMRLR